MKNCIRIPRVFLPRNNFETWAVTACDRHPYDRLYWERVAQEKGDAPSALFCIFPDAFRGEEQEARLEELRESMYMYLENGVLERLNRGMVLVERTTSKGVRRGLLANIDLEEYSPESEKGAIVRASTETLPSIVETRLQVRQKSVLEFPHAVLLYRDKKDKVLRGLYDDLEQLYDIELPEGGSVKAYFIPEEEAEFTAHDLIAKADPCFVVADGNHSLAAAKAHWDELKSTLLPAEMRNHPARFMLVEFVNAQDPAVAFEPVHRVVRDIEPEAFCDYFCRKVKSKREKNILYPILSGADSYASVDKTIGEFIRQNYGRVEYRSDRPSLLGQDDCVVVALPAVETEELYAAVKGGKRFPAKTFCLGAETDARYSIEGREISYD